MTGVVPLDPEAKMGMTPDLDVDSRIELQKRINEGPRGRGRSTGRGRVTVKGTDTGTGTAQAPRLGGMSMEGL